MLFGAFFTIAGCLLSAGNQPPRTTGLITLFEGARLIVGDGSAPIESSAFLVQNDRFTKIGRKGQLQPPAGAVRVDLGGTSVMPALVDDHVHLGYRKGLSFTADNYTRETLLDTLDRFAYYGVAAVLEAGTGRGDLPFQVRNEARSGARYLTAATRNAADILGLNQLGTVAVGKSADFIVLDANPLEDVARTRRISKVYLRGIELNRAGLKAMWAASQTR